MFGTDPESPLQTVAGMESGCGSAPGEDTHPALLALDRCSAKRSRFGGHGGLGAPHRGVECGREGEFNPQMFGRQADGTLEPAAPLLLAHRVGVLDPYRLARVQREAALFVLEQQPDFLESVAVVLGLPAHRLAAAGRSESKLIPGQRVFAVVGVGPFRLARVAVDADADQVAGDRFAAGVPQQTAHRQPVETAVVVQAGCVVLDDDCRAGRVRLLNSAGGWYGRRWRRAGLDRLEVQPALPDRLARVQGFLRAAGEVLGRFVPTRFDVTHVRRVEGHPSGQLSLGQTPYLAPVGDFRRERLGCLLDCQGVVPRVHQSPRLGCWMR